MKKRYSGYTLIELIVVIAIIMILAVAASSVNFSRSTDTQYLLAFTNSLASSIEKQRNDALIGRAVGNNLEVPNSYKVQLSTASSGSLTVFYNTGGTFITDVASSIWVKPFQSISRLICHNPSFTLTGSSTQVDLMIQKNTLSLSGCTVWGNTGSILEIETKYKALTKQIFINTLTWRIEKK